MLRKYQRIVLMLFLVCSLILLTGCSEEYSIEDLKEKVMSEINYLDSKILAISNNLNGINSENYKVSIVEIPKSENSANSQGNGEGKQNSSSEESTGEMKRKQ